MEIGFIGLGKMGFPMARRLIEAKHRLTVFDTRQEAIDKLVEMGAQAASSPKDVADRAETVMASLPSLQASLEVATGANGVIEGKRVKRFVDLSTVGSAMAVRIHDSLGERNIVQLDSPVSGGVGGAEKGTLAVMVDVINAGSGRNTASRDKFPRAVLPRSFDFGFATGLMVKDVRLCLEEMKSLGLSMEVAEAVGRLWEIVIRDMGPESDFTSAIKPIEKAAGVVVGGTKGGHAAK